MEIIEMKLSIVTVLLVLVFSFPAMAGDQGKAKIITGFNNAAQCIAPVHVRKIDGREATVQPMGFDLEPGTHSLKGSAVVDVSNCPTVGKSYNNSRIEPIEAEFEAGKTYYLGYDHNATDRKDWKLVIWKVEDQDG
jgi:hypothetical protein